MINRLLAACMAAFVGVTGHAYAESYDFSTFSIDGQNYQGAHVGVMTLTSEIGHLFYTDEGGGGLSTDLGADGNVYFDFSAPVNQFSIRAGDGGGDADAFGVRAYEYGTNAFLGTWYTPLFGNNADNQWYTLAINATNIGRIAFDPCNGGNCPGILGNAGGVVVTDISFSVSAVPEPSTYAMMLAGVALVGSIARRRKTV